MRAGRPLQLTRCRKNMPKLMFAGTATILFAIINLMKVPPYLALGLIDGADLRTIAALSPVAGLRRLARLPGYPFLIHERVFFILVEIALLLISVNLIRVGVAGL